MSQSFKRIKKTLFLLLTVILILGIPVSFAYWDTLSKPAQQKQKTSLTVGDYAGSPLDRLPPHVPLYVIERLNEIAQNYPDMLDRLIDAVISITEGVADYDHYFDYIHIGASSSDLFGTGQQISANDILIYGITNGDGSTQVIIVHIGSSGGFDINSPEDLDYALERPWTGINQISSLWMRGNSYTVLTAPVEYQGRYYLMNHTGPAGIEPPNDRNTWFEISLNYEYNPLNSRYLKNYIVQLNGQFYVAHSAVWGGNPESATWAWTAFDVWQNGGYAAGNIVYTEENGAYRFWQALRQTSSNPDEESAKQGLWREINNGWFGKDSESEVRSHYFYHNTYAAGDVIIYGVSPNMTHRFYEAVTAVPHDEPPLKTTADGLVLNSEYWKAY